jgi:oxygen-independent coproporphyrinogen-3 oxidase
MEGISKGDPVSESEHLTAKEQYHDYLITSLRTTHGIETADLTRRFGEEISHHFERSAGGYLENGFLIRSGSRITIDPENWLTTDHILRDLFMT